MAIMAVGRNRKNRVLDYATDETNFAGFGGYAAHGDCVGDGSTASTAS